MAPVCRVVDDKRLLERDHARIGVTVVHQDAAMQVVVKAQRLQRRLFQPLAKHRAAER